MSARARALLVGIVVIGLLVVGGIASYFAWQDHLYVKTDDATVAGNVVSVYAPAAGTLTAWNAGLSKHVTAGTVLGVVHEDAQAGQNGQPSRSAADVDIKAPTDGVIVQSTGAVGQQVFPGTTPLAAMVDPSNLWIQANVDEGAVHRLQLGQRVDIRVDAVPDDSFTGSVQAINDATQSTFSVLPSNSGSGSFTKVSQRVPVRISLDEPTTSGLPVGGSAEVTIHVS